MLSFVLGQPPLNERFIIGEYTASFLPYCITVTKPFLNNLIWEERINNLWNVIWDDRYERFFAFDFV
jgi:hypothetical protein